MPSLAMVAAAAGAGRVVPAKPTLTHYTTTGQFQITNYSSLLTYTLSVTAGTATRSTDIITMSNPDSVCTVTARGPKSLSDSAAATAERKTYTTNQNNVDVSYIHAPPEHGNSNIGGPPGTRWLRCGTFPWGTECGHQEGTNDKNPTPSGYTDSYGEWWKVT